MASKRSRTAGEGAEAGESSAGSSGKEEKKLGDRSVGRKRKRSSVLGRIPTPKLKAPSLPKPDAVVKAVSQAAGQVADGSHRVGEVAAQVQRASEAINGSRSSDDR